MRSAARGVCARGDRGVAPFSFRLGALAAVGPAVLAGLLGGAAAVLAQDTAPRPVYRCPGPPVLYTDAISPQEAQSRGCRTIEGAAVTVIQAPPRPPPAASVPGAPSGGAPAAARPEARVDPLVQRSRDAEARRILEAELRREEERLAEMLREFNNGEPERQGNERNFATYQQRVADMRAAIDRKQADIAALRREIGKLAP